MNMGGRRHIVHINNKGKNDDYDLNTEYRTHISYCVCRENLIQSYMIVN